MQIINRLCDRFPIDSSNKYGHSLCNEIKGNEQIKTFEGITKSGAWRTLGGMSGTVVLADKIRILQIFNASVSPDNKALVHLAFTDVGADAGAMMIIGLMDQGGMDSAYGTDVRAI